MRINWATDIHLDHVATSAQFSRLAAGLSDGEGDRIAVVTGDIGSFPNSLMLLGELKEEIPIPLYFVLGNHDYYGGSLKEMRSAAFLSTRFTYLPMVDDIPLGSGAYLIGVDGWADAQEGDYDKSPVVLNDSVHIEDMRKQRMLSPGHMKRFMQKMGREEASSLKWKLSRALGHGDVSHVVIATHIPPFRGATWHEGEISNNDFLPFFCCRATGEEILSAADTRKDVRFTVLCGHTHGGGTYQASDNVIVHTGAAAYGKPLAQTPLEI